MLESVIITAWVALDTCFSQLLTFISTCSVPFGLREIATFTKEPSQRIRSPSFLYLKLHRSGFCHDSQNLTKTSGHQWLVYRRYSHHFYSRESLCQEDQRKHTKQVFSWQALVESYDYSLLKPKNGLVKNSEGLYYVRYNYFYSSIEN